MYLPVDRSDRFLPSRLVASGYEIVLVLFLTLGYSIYLSSKIALKGRTFIGFPSDNWPLVNAIFVEGVPLLILLIYLYKKGWTSADLKFEPSWKGIRDSLALTIAALVSSNVTSRTIQLLVQAHTSSYVVSLVPLNAQSHINQYCFLAAIVLNALFEQIICMSYAFSQLACKYGALTAILGSTAIRLSYHTWQSPTHLSGTFIAFLIYAVWYWYNRNVWTLFLAEIFYDTYIYSGLIATV